MRGKPDVRTFLESGTADLEDAPKAKPPVAQVQKIFRLDWEVAKDLKLKAANLSAERGERVTETEIVEQLLRAYLYK